MLHSLQPVLTDATCVSCDVAREGYNKYGWDKYGYDRLGYSRDGYHREGYYKGYDKYGERY